MLKRIFFVTAIMLLAHVIHAQNTTIKWGEDDKRVLYEDNKGQLVYYNGDLTKSLKSLKLNMKLTQDNCFAHTPEHFYSCGVVWEKKPWVRVPYFLEVDSQGSPKNKIDYPGPAQSTDGGKYGALEGELALSDDQSLCLAINYPLNGGRNFFFKVSDEHLKPIWERDLEVSKEKDVSISPKKIHLTSMGKAFIVGRVYAPGKGISYAFLAVTSKSFETVPFVLDGGNIPTSFEIIDIDENSVLIAGLYDDGQVFENQKTAKGSFAIVYSFVTGRIALKKMYPFNTATFPLLKLEEERKNDEVTFLKPGWINGIRAVGLYKSADNNYMLVTDWLQPYVSSAIAYSKIMIGFNSELGKTYETVINAKYRTYEFSNWIKGFNVNNKVMLLYKTGGRDECFLKATSIDFTGKVVADDKYEISDRKYHVWRWETYRYNNQVVIGLREKQYEPATKFAVLKVNESR